MSPSDFLPAVHPALPDLKSCDEWLANATLADPGRACAAFVELLDELEDAPPPAGTYLRILERLRKSVQAAQEEQAKRFGAKLLPLGPAENSAFVQACDLWLALLRAWRTLLRASEKDPRPEIQPARTLLALRVLECSAGLIGAHFVARREVAEDLWHWLHRSYAFAEEAHLAEAEIPGTFAAEGRTCVSVYAELLLVQLSNPYALGTRDLAWVQRWARRWSSKARLWRSAEGGGGIAVDLEGSAGAAWMPAGTPGASIRYLDCSEVLRSINKRIRKLAENAHPAELGLGGDCTRPAVDELLARLARCWGNAPLAHRFPRRAAASRAELVAGLAEAHHAISGEEFEGAAKPWHYSRQAAEEIHIFQHTIEMEAARVHRAGPESWDMLDESANGFRLRRSVPGARLTHRQLVALRPSGSRRFILCEIRSLSQCRDDSLVVGLRALPGLPQSCSVRSIADDPARPAARLQAFVLPVAVGLAPSLVLPIGSYQNSRELELKLEDKALRIRLSGLLERGHDYERANFSATSSGSGN